MFEESPFSGACAYSVWEVLIMLGGTLLLGVLLGYLIWGWTKRKLAEAMASIQNYKANVTQLSNDLEQSRKTETEQMERIRNLEVRVAELESSLRHARAELEEARTAIANVDPASEKTEKVAATQTRNSPEPFSFAASGDSGTESSSPEVSEFIDEAEPSSEELVRATEIMGKDIQWNDLTVIEGIGPQIAGVLHRSGISSWTQLSGTTRHILRVILDEAGPQFRMHKPKTWPRQAKMARKGEWKKLKAYQDVLIGGK